VHIQDNDTQRNLSTVSEPSEMKQNLLKSIGKVGPWSKAEPTTDRQYIDHIRTNNAAEHALLGTHTYGTTTYILPGTQLLISATSRSSNQVQKQTQNKEGKTLGL